jgi:ectoine hydroxylase
LKNFAREWEGIATCLAKIPGIPRLSAPCYLDQETVTRLAQEGGIVAPTGKPGSVLMFHGNLVHGPAPNITPYPRRIVYLTLCAVSNYIRKPTRPEWIAHRDFTPIEPVADSALLDYARGYRAAAE